MEHGPLTSRFSVRSQLHLAQPCPRPSSASRPPSPETNSKPGPFGVPLSHPYSSPKANAALLLNSDLASTPSPSSHPRVRAVPSLLNPASVSNAAIMANQNPSTPVKVPSSAANHTAATLDPDLRSQINSILIKEGHVTKYVYTGFPPCRSLCSL